MNRPFEPRLLKARVRLRARARTDHKDRCEIDLYRPERCFRDLDHRAGRVSDLLRKEVIQPQVPLRLPCYDFTPITDHTLGACLPCGLAQRLLVQPTFVV